jgi:hypothetical protein
MGNLQERLQCPEASAERSTRPWVWDLMPGLEAINLCQNFARDDRAHRFGTISDQ